MHRCCSAYSTKSNRKNVWQTVCMLTSVCNNIPEKEWERWLCDTVGGIHGKCEPIPPLLPQLLADPGGSCSVGLMLSSITGELEEVEKWSLSPSDVPMAACWWWWLWWDDESWERRGCSEVKGQGAPSDELSLEIDRQLCKKMRAQCTMTSHQYTHNDNRSIHTQWNSLKTEYQTSECTLCIHNHCDFEPILFKYPKKALLLDVIQATSQGQQT